MFREFPPRPRCSAIHEFNSREKDIQRAGVVTHARHLTQLLKQSYRIRPDQLRG
jgi:hypothetical protein